MKVVYFGTSGFAVPALERIADSVVLVVTQPDRPSGRGMELKSSDVKTAALRFGLELAEPIKSRSPEFVERLLSLGADLFIVASYGQILSRAVLDLPRFGCYNLHASLLPRHRGASPIQSAILCGDAETGVTLMRMDEGMDTGAMVDKALTKIGDDETAGELHNRLAIMAADLLERWIGRLASGDVVAEPQEASLATHAPKYGKSDAELSFGRAALGEYRRFRAFTPIPGAFLRTKHGVLKLKSARLSGLGGLPGHVVQVKPEFAVAFREGSLELQAVQPEGRRIVSGTEYVNGARIAVGDCLLP